MRLKSLVRRRPSASLLVSFAALFVSLGGVGWAAIHLPPGSVGNAQLQNNSVGLFKLRPNSVGAHKIINGSVGASQVNSSQVQLRVSTSCMLGAVQSIGLSGTVTCTPTLPNEYGTSAPPVTLGASSTQIATKSLPAGSSFLILAYPRATITGTTSQRVEVDCTLSVPSGTTTTKSLAGSGSLVGTIPLVLPIASATSAQAATVSCTDTATPSTPAPTVTVDTTINAIQTASNS